jgi:methylated-DNA-[protein]-cysteine S-methyltransferase
MKSLFTIPLKKVLAKKDLPPLLIQCIEELIQYFHGERRVFEFPLNQEGSDFQKKTWNLLMTIPYAKNDKLCSARH